MTLRIALGTYLAVFALAGVWSVMPDDPRTPVLERFSEAVAFIVLAFGMLMFLMDRPVPGGEGAWLTVTGLAAAVEFLVVLRDRSRTIRDELVATDDPNGMRRLFRLNDLFITAFFLPAVLVNVRYAVR